MITRDQNGRRVIVEPQPLLAEAADRNLSAEKTDRVKVLIGELMILVMGDRALSARPNRF